MWALAGLWGAADTAAVLTAAADHFGAETVADALALGARWPTVVGIDAGRLLAMADAWRGVS